MFGFWAGYFFRKLIEETDNNNNEEKTSQVPFVDWESIFHKIMGIFPIILIIFAITVFVKYWDEISVVLERIFCLNR